MPGCILKNTADKTLIRALAEAITREYELQIQSGNEVIKQLVNTFITVAARNISLKQLHNGMPSEQPVSLQGYIHQNIYSPEKLQVAAFANEFNISPNYLGELFKKQTGLTLQRYIASYRLKLIEARLRYTNNRMNEIATEFGFSDMSHLNKFFTRHNGISPSAYRKNAKL
ncbi:AraC family transcriptional regulator [Flavobacterium sp. ST-75]|uniref:AraC family transcriptional regulator n=1 Tax=Flavobacterium rhizophilum TaxID=3163296 RepID=A0ABW8YB26_9FLAO